MFQWLMVLGATIPREKGNSNVLISCFLLHLVEALFKDSTPSRVLPPYTDQAKLSKLSSEVLHLKGEKQKQVLISSEERMTRKFKRGKLS
jgi:hypothetical protein